jgi:Tfp pilus assembly protein PilF
MHPTSDNARVELALGDIYQGRFKSAVVTLKTVLQSNPQDHDARYALATALRSLGKLDESNAHFRMASQGQNRMSIARYLTVRLLADETNVDLRREIGELYLQFGSEGEGLAWLDSALELAPRHRPTLQILADYYQKKSVDRPQAKQLETEYKQRLQKL